MAATCPGAVVDYYARHSPCFKFLPTRSDCRSKRYVMRRSDASVRSCLSQYDGELEKAKWTGDDPLARFVKAIISIKPLHRLIALGARQSIIRTAEKNGIRWKEMVKQLEVSEVYSEKDLVENKSISYPDYYTREFHAYPDGNLSWQAAFEVEQAGMVVARNAFPQAESIDAALEGLRGTWVQAIENHHRTFSSDHPVRAVIDIGCSVGVSTRYIADRFSDAYVTGLDLSPYFLAVAQFSEKQRSAKGLARKRPIDWIHANAEDTKLASKSFDIVSLAFVVHECPQHITRNVVKEAHRLLRPGGTIAFLEQSPKSKVIQNLAPATFTMMKSTEPWLDEFYKLDLENVLQENFFTNVRSIFTSPRHATVTATAV